MKVIRDTVGLVADVTGILAFIGLSATGIVAWLGPKGTPVFATFLVIFTVLLVAYIVLKKFIPNFAERAFRNSATDKPLLLQAYNLKNRLPADHILQELQAELQKQIQKWDKKATCVSSELYASISQDGQLYTLSVIVQSIWKRREAEFSIKADGEQKTKVMEHYKSLRQPMRSSIDKAFFSMFPDWQDRVISAYGPMEDRPKNYLYINVGVTAAKKELQVSVRDDSKTEA